MSARKKSRRKPNTSRARRTIEAALRDLEKRLPANLRGPVRDLRANLASLQKQMDKARKDREDRWRRLEAQVRKDTARLLRRLEKAVAGGAGPRKASTGKKTSRKKTSGKKTARKKTAARKKTPRKKSTRKKTTRKKTSRR
jgi:hypothetical protein